MAAPLQNSSCNRKPTKAAILSPAICCFDVGDSKNRREKLMTVRRPLLAFAAVVLLAGIPPATAQDKSIVVASTTSTQDSGLFEYLLPIFKQETGITVKVLAQGTGQALDTGRRGDADVVFVHARSAEEKFLAEGQGVKRYPVMYNDFVLIGPKSDPAGIRGMTNVARALHTIKDKQASFISRGDRSGTHIAELQLWKDAGIDIEKDLHDKNLGPWYKSIGQGMGAALNTAGASNAYVLADRASWLRFKNKGDLAILVQGDKRLFNQYGVMLVNPEKHPTVKKDLGQIFIDWLISPNGQKAIGSYKVNGEQLFIANASDPKA
jgi:tungstate transport system substrate-binding protein